MDLQTDLSMLTQLTMHLIEEMSFPPVQVGQQIGTVTPPPVPIPGGTIPQGKQTAPRAYQGALFKLEMMKEIKQRILDKQKFIEEINAQELTKEDTDQLRKEIQELTDQINKIKGEK